jgi:hypothetical protein
MSGDLGGLPYGNHSINVLWAAINTNHPTQWPLVVSLFTLAEALGLFVFSNRCHVGACVGKG